MSANRLEAFSDGVLAVAITLLVLDIRVPPIGSPGSLGHELARQWPIYAAYVTSFLTIGIIWINHHAMTNRLEQADHSILVLNLFLLLSIGVLPFATSLMSAYLKHPQGQHLAAAIYSGAFLVMSLMFSALNRQILIKRPHLLKVQLSSGLRRRILARSLVGLVPYVIATALAALSAYLTLAICALVALFYALPMASRDETEVG
ncbi:MAG: DUF1211 domain-containing protein [Solirubrobacterales bacterium]|nr:DUF1211 domain-containing protein [Solirubrobacterales bacterium]